MFCYLRERQSDMKWYCQLWNKSARQTRQNSAWNVFGWIIVFTTIIGYNQQFLAWLDIFDDCVVDWVTKSADTTIERVCNFEYHIRDVHHMLGYFSLRPAILCHLRQLDSTAAFKKFAKAYILEVMGQLERESYQCLSDNSFERLS